MYLFVSCCGWIVATEPKPLVASDLETSGDILQIAIPAAGYGLTFLYDDPRGREQFYYGFGTTVAVTQVLKNTVDRIRPNFGENAFPSGHTSASFQGAAFIQRRYGEELGNFQWFPYLLAGYVGYTRIEATKHHLGDVIGGAVIGTLSSYVWTTPQNRAVKVSVVASSDFVGLKVNYALGQPEPDSSGWADRIEEKFAFDVPTFDELAEDPYIYCDPTPQQLRFDLITDVIGLPDRAGGWIMIRPVFTLPVICNHDVRVEVPYVESDLNREQEFRKGIGDLRLQYRYQVYTDESNEYFFRNAALALEGIFPTGEDEDGLSAREPIIIPKVSGSILFGDWGIFPEVRYLHSASSTSAQSIPGDLMIIPVVPGRDDEEDIRTIQTDLFVMRQFRDRYSIALTPEFQYDFARDEGSLSARADIGMKLTDRTSFTLDVSRRIAGEKNITARFAIRVHMFF